MSVLRPQGILKSASVNLSARIVEGVLGLIQVVLIAREFGISATTDAYMIAVWLPMFFCGIGETILIYSLVPYLVAVQEKGGRRAEMEVVNGIFFWFALLLGGISLLVLFAAPILPYLLAPGFTEETRVLTADLLRWLSPVILLGGIGGFASCLFYASHRFAVPAIALLIPDLGVIGFLLYGADRWGVGAPVMGLFLGVAVQTLVLFLALFFLGKFPRFRYSPVRQFLNVARLIGPRLGGASINRFNIGVDRFFASMIGGGAVSALAYSYRLVQLPIGLAVVTFGKTLMPALTREVVRNGSESLRGLIPKCIGFAGFGLIPVILFFAFYSEFIIRIFYQRGAFDAGAVQLASKVFFFYSLGILFNALCIIFQGAFYALRDTLTPLKVNLTALVLNIVLDVVLMNLMGLAGIALASVLVSLFSLIFLHSILKRQIGGLEREEMIRLFRKIVPVSIILGGLVWLSAGWFAPYVAVMAFKMQIVLTMAAFLASWGVYLILCKWLKVEEYGYLARLIEKRLG